MKNSLILKDNMIENYNNQNNNSKDNNNKDNNNLK